MDFKKVIYHTRSHVAYITLNDKNSLNAFGTELAYELLQALELAQEDADISVIVLAGGHGHFSSGGDIKEMLSVGMESEALSAKIESLVTNAGIISRKIREIEKPIIAKLQGAVTGAGFNLALTCDFRVASDDAMFIQSFIHIGLMPDAGGIYLLNQLIGASKATEYAMLGEKVTAQQAYSLNLLYQVTSLDTLDTAVDDLAIRLVQMPKTALATIKHMVNETAFHNFSQTLDMETQHQSILAKTDDFKEGITAFVEKRQPAYIP